MKRIVRLVAIVALIGTPIWPVLAQNQVTMGNSPQILAVGHGEVRVSPDRATIQIGVESRALTAAAASADNANKQAAVVAAIKRLGVADDQITTSNYSVTPEQRYDANHPPVITGYVVTNTVVVDVRKIASVGPVLDAALAAGANVISSLSFYSSNIESARRAAIAAAVSSARADAEAAARAAGGTLGGLIEVNVGFYSPPVPRPLMMNSAISARTMQADTPISPGLQTISVDVTTRWRFVGPT
jgi:Uncharacterized conserved protein